MALARVKLMKNFLLPLLCLPLALLIFLVVLDDLPYRSLLRRIQDADKVVVAGKSGAYTTHPREVALLKAMFVGGSGFWMRCGGGEIRFYQGGQLLEAIDFQIVKSYDRIWLNLLYEEWGKRVLLGSYSMDAAALVERLANGECDCDSHRRGVLAAR